MGLVAGVERLLTDDSLPLMVVMMKREVTETQTMRVMTSKRTS